jgi:hypothetical protein
MMLEISSDFLQLLLPKDQKKKTALFVKLKIGYHLSSLSFSLIVLAKTSAV